METLPDYLSPGLAIVFVGLNPSTISVRAGHYFANPRNRFWAAFNQSGLVSEEVTAELDYTLPEHGIGLTDVVKRATSQGSGLRAADYRQWAPVLKQKLEACQPLVACYHGMMGYRSYLQYAEGIRLEGGSLGEQPHRIGSIRVFVTPNPSPANARYSVTDLAGWYRELGRFVDRLREA